MKRQRAPKSGSRPESVVAADPHFAEACLALEVGQGLDEFGEAHSQDAREWMLATRRTQDQIAEVRMPD